MWKSREGQEPPPSFWADFVANVNALFPGANLDKPTLSELYSLVVDEWRNGTQLHLIVRQLCSCDGNTVVPSEGARLRLGKHRGLARAPLEATPGQAFGLAELRDPAPLARLIARKALVSARVRSETQKRPTQQREDRLKSLRQELAELTTQEADYRRDAYWTPPHHAAAPHSAALPVDPVPDPQPQDADVRAARKSRGERANTAKKGRIKQSTQPPPITSAPASNLDPLDEDLAEQFANEIAKRS